MVFMGTPDFALGSMEALKRGGYRISAVFTQPDKPKGRSNRPTPPPVKEAALAEGIAVYQPKKISAPENLEILRAIAPDIIVVTAFGQIIPSSILHLPPYGCANVHASLLPMYRGAAPIQWAVINGDEKSGVTTMQMDEGLDTGDILLKKEVPIDEQETGESLFEKLKEAGGELLLDTLKGLEEGSITPEKQPAQSPTPYARMLTREMGRLDFNRPATQLERLVRGLYSWPGTFTKIGEKTLKILRTKVITPEAYLLDTGADPSVLDVPAGMVLPGMKGRLLVKCGCDILELLEVQPEGKKRMMADAYLRGLRAEGNICFY